MLQRVTDIRRPSGAPCDVDVETVGIDEGEVEDQGEDEGEAEDEGEEKGRRGGEKGGLGQERRLFNSCPWSFPGPLSSSRGSCT